MLGSLDSLVNTIKDDKKNFKLLYEAFGKKADLLQRKGVYCYDYMSDFDKYNETELPSIGEFFNSLTGEEISVEDYNYAQKLFKIFKCKTMWDYTLLYLRCDVYLLMAIFEQFRKMSLAQYALEPSKYFSCPGLSWDAALKFTGVELELLSDPDMYTFIEKGIRGGVATVPHRYASVKNKYTHQEGEYDKNNQEYLAFYDINNSYGKLLCVHLPVRNFNWVKSEEIKHFKLEELSKTSKTGAILEVDLYYDKAYMDRDNDFPLAPSKIAVPYSSLSRFQKQMIETSNIHYNEKQEKLVLHFLPRIKYVVHRENLKYYLSRGMI